MRGVLSGLGGWRMESLRRRRAERTLHDRGVGAGVRATAASVTREPAPVQGTSWFADEFPPGLREGGRPRELPAEGGSGLAGLR